MSRVFTGSNVLNCSASVVQDAVPIVSDFVATEAKLTDLDTKVTTIFATCSASGPLAAPCFLIQAIINVGNVVNDVSAIAAYVKDIIQKVPILQQEIQFCSSVIKNATTDAKNLTDTIKTCVNNSVSSTP
jgi:hypothetical protein